MHRKAATGKVNVSLSQNLLVHLKPRLVQLISNYVSAPPTVQLFVVLWLHVVYYSRNLLTDPALDQL
jgi:hypothetical protein